MLSSVAATVYSTLVSATECYRSFSDLCIYTGALTLAIQAIPNLRSFRWYGDSPNFSRDVLDALVQSAGQSLEVFHIPYCLLYGFMPLANYFFLQLDARGTC